MSVPPPTPPADVGPTPTASASTPTPTPSPSTTPPTPIPQPSTPTSLSSLPPSLRAWLEESLAGTIGGVAGLVVGYPFDTVRVRLQQPETAKRYGGMVNAFRVIVREERVSGLFKGITSPLLTLAPLNGLVFGAYGYFLRLQCPSPEATPSLSQVALAGTLAGILGATIAAPVELVKIRQQNVLGPAAGVGLAGGVGRSTRTGAGPGVSTGGMNVGSSTLGVVREIVRRRGVRGLYRGFTATALRDAGGGPYFLVYEALTRLSPPSPLTPLLAGGAAGLVGWLSTFPFDVIKTRMQSVDRPAVGPAPTTPAGKATGTGTGSGSGSGVRAAVGTVYASTWSTAKESWRKEGWRGFWRGLRPALIESVPVNMATFGAFELVLHFIR